MKKIRDKPKFVYINRLYQYSVDINFFDYNILLLNTN